MRVRRLDQMRVLLAVFRRDVVLLVLLHLVDDFETVELLLRGRELVVLAPRHLMDDLTPQFRVNLGVREL